MIAWIGLGRNGNSGVVSERVMLAIGGSAGGVEALIEAVATLSADLPAPVLVTVHIGEQARSILPRILSRHGPLPARHARDGEPLRAGRIYVAPPGHHLLVHGGNARLSAGPRINHHRPAIDAMFASGARWADGRTVAAVLSGTLDDGAVGAALVARAGGRVLTQDPEEAAFASMPLAALRAAPGATSISMRELGACVDKIIREQPPISERPRGGEYDMAPHDSMEDSDDPGYLAADESQLTRLRCPECGGPLAQIDLAKISYYRCHVGHQYAPRTLEAAQRKAAEAQLWTAVSSLEEHAALARHLANGNSADPQRYLHSAQRSAELAKSVRARLNPPAAPVERG